jgi:hypothetical protein
MKPGHLAIEAIVCALPSVWVGAVGSLIFIGSGVSMLGYEPLEGAKSIAIAFGLIFALFQYGRLAGRTVFGEQYKFGLVFWPAAGFGSLGVWYAFGFFGPALGAVIALPLVGATLHFVWLQMKLHRRGSHNVA